MYPDAVNLPFNGAIIKADFVPAVPGAEDPQVPGYWLLIQGKNSLLVNVGEGSPALPEGVLPESLTTEAVPIYLGQWRGKPLRVLRIGRDVKIEPPLVAEPFNAMEDRLDDRLLTIGGMAQQILYWLRQTACCSRCGGQVGPIPGTWGKKCTGCSQEHFPHIHPCVIVLVRRGEEFLLARKPEWPSGRYSLIAGFLDFGECLEECVQREVKEETGIEVCNIRYVGSQNWPFPSQLMAGFVADYAGGEIRVDKSELEDARWFSREAMPQSLPTRRSIARWIIDTFAVDQPR